MTPTLREFLPLVRLKSSENWNEFHANSDKDGVRILAIKAPAPVPMAPKLSQPKRCPGIRASEGLAPSAAAGSASLLEKERLNPKRPVFRSVDEKMCFSSMVRYCRRVRFSVGNTPIGSGIFLSASSNVKRTKKLSDCDAW